MPEGLALRDPLRLRGVGITRGGAAAAAFPTPPLPPPGVVAPPAVGLSAAAALARGGSCGRWLAVRSEASSAVLRRRLGDDAAAAAECGAAPPAVEVAALAAAPRCSLVGGTRACSLGAGARGAEEAGRLLPPGAAAAGGGAAVAAAAGGSGAIAAAGAASGAAADDAATAAAVDSDPAPPVASVGAASVSPAAGADFGAGFTGPRCWSDCSCVSLLLSSCPAAAKGASFQFIRGMASEGGGGWEERAVRRLRVGGTGGDCAATLTAAERFLPGSLGGRADGEEAAIANKAGAAARRDGVAAAMPLMAVDGGLALAGLGSALPAKATTPLSSVPPSARHSSSRLPHRDSSASGEYRMRSSSIALLLLLWLLMIPSLLSEWLLSGNETKPPRPSASLPWHRDTPSDLHTRLQWTLSSGFCI